MNYNFNLPSELIAHEPAEPRDAARLMVYSIKTNEVLFDTLARIARYVPESSLLVVNDTQVVPARIVCTKITGETVRIFFFLNEWDGSTMIHGLPDRKIMVGDTLYVKHRPFAMAVTQHKDDFEFKLLISSEEFEKQSIVHEVSQLPSYVHSVIPQSGHQDSHQDNKSTSAASPVSSLHFTDRVLASFAEKRIEKVQITQHVGRGTPPISNEVQDKGELHLEPIHVSQEAAVAISEAKKANKTIFASRATVVRALESSATQILAGSGYDGNTTLVIKPPYKFQVVDALITNFHIPNTGLLMLVDTFLQSKGAKKSWKDLYEVAIHEKFRFDTLGDVMMIV